MNDRWSCTRKIKISETVENAGIMDARYEREPLGALLAYVTGLINQELLLKNEYLAAENRILRAHLRGLQFSLRPNFTPRAFAAFTPARVIRHRSTSARTPIICHMARPVGVSVSMASVNERNFRPRHRPAR
jgi:hypothetical protein